MKDNKLISMGGRVQVYGKTLWHIQNMNICTDGSAYDMFLWAENEPTEEELVKAFLDDYIDATPELVDEWRTSSDVYAVYAEELCQR